MVVDDVQLAYDRRSVEYAELFGSMDAVHPADRALVDYWSDNITGTVLDAGCGPGHWSSYLDQRGLVVHGLDLSPRFVQHARAAFPHIAFEVGSLDAIPAASEALDGILAWYSLIHTEPARIPATLTEFARVLRPGGALLLGFFEGPEVLAFDHAVVTAHSWPVTTLAQHLRSAGFEVEETHSRTGPGYRPHGAITALRHS